MAHTSGYQRVMAQTVSRCPDIEEVRIWY